MTANVLRALTCKDLAQLAKKDGVSGWHAMRKEELIRALLLTSRRKSRRKVGHNGGADADRPLSKEPWIGNH